MAGEQGVLELRQHGVLVAEHPVEQRLPGGDAGDRVGPDLLLDGARLPPRRAQLADRGGRDGAASCVRRSRSRTYRPIADRRPGGSDAVRSGGRPAGGSSQIGTLPRRGSVGGVERPSVADDDLRRDGIGLDIDDSSWPERRPCPGTGGRHPKFAASDGPLLYRRRFDAATPGRRAAPLDHVRRASSTRPTCGSTAPTSATRRATSSRTASTSPRSSTARRRPRARRRGHVLARAGHVAGGATSPACSSTPRPSTATGTRAGCGARCSSTTPARCASTGCACSAATPTRSGPTSACTPGSTPTSPAPSGCARRADGVAVGETEHAARRRRQRDRVVARRRPSPTPVVAARASATSRSPTIGVEVLVDGERERPARRAAPVCARSRWSNWICSVNGERLFLKGANLAADAARAWPTPHRPRCARDVELAVEAGLDALRVQAHIAGPELYDAADELGMLVLQDFPLQWGYGRYDPPRGGAPGARGGRRRSATTRRSSQWCAHDEPVADAPQVEGDRAAVPGVRRFVRQQLPTWNKSVLDRWVKRAFEQADPTRPDDRPRRRAPPPPPARRHRQPPVARLAPRRGRATWPTRPAPCPATGPLRQRVRRPVGAGQRRRVRRHHALARARLGRPRRAPRPRGRRDAGPPPAGAATPRSPPGARRPSATRPSCCASTSRPSAGSSTGRPAASRFSWLADPAPMISAVGARPRPPARSWPGPAVVEACRPVIVVTDPLPATLAAGRARQPRRARRQRPARGGGGDGRRSRRRGAAAAGSGRSAATSPPTRASSSAGSTITVARLARRAAARHRARRGHRTGRPVAATRRAGARVVAPV